MRAWALTQHQPRQTSPASLMRPGALAPGASHDAHALMPVASATTPLTHDFSRLPAHASARLTTQSMRVHEPTLQRACACGGSCPRCQTKQPARERPREETIQAASRETGRTTAPPIVEEALADGGGSLPGRLRADMEHRFGHDFGHVRLHTHVRAAESAAAVGASAYTVGRDVVFAAGTYAPDTRAGRRLIAHELAHVVQQDGTRASSSHGRGIALGAVDDPLERQAEIAARRASEDAEPRPAGASLSAGMRRVARAPVLQRDTPGKKEETPITRVPYREDALAKGGATEAEEGDEEEGPPLILASAARPACDPQGFLRKDYLAQPHTSTDDFGLTRFAGTARMALTTKKVSGGVMLEPLNVALPPITSVYTKVDTFIEGTIEVHSQEDAECKGGEVPLQWQIFAPGAAKIREGEVEHCQDLQYAYDVSLGWYGQVVDGLIAKSRKFPSETAAFKHLKKVTGTHPTGWLSVFECLANKTKNRDGRKFATGWHTPRVRTHPPRTEDGCKFARTSIVGAENFRELGKHPTADVIKKCGESQDAVKALQTGP